MRVTVVPIDNIILVDGFPLQFKFDAPENLHALQWDEDKGHLEFKNGDPNQMLSKDDYDKYVAHYVEVWKVEKKRLEDEAEAAEAARLAVYNSEEARFERLRAERDRRINETDYLMTSDYPLSDEKRALVSAYRTALRDLPEQTGAPWDGGESETPWPVMPDLK